MHLSFPLHHLIILTIRVTVPFIYLLLMRDIYQELIVISVKTKDATAAVWTSVASKMHHSLRPNKTLEFKFGE